MVGIKGIFTDPPVMEDKIFLDVADATIRAPLSVATAAISPLSRKLSGIRGGSWAQHRGFCSVY